MNGSEDERLEGDTTEERGEDTRKKEREHWEEWDRRINERKARWVELINLKFICL